MEERDTCQEEIASIVRLFLPNVKNLIIQKRLNQIKKLHSLNSEENSNIHYIQSWAQRLRLWLCSGRWKSIVHVTHTIDFHVTYTIDFYLQYSHCRNLCAYDCTPRKFEISRKCIYDACMFYLFCISFLVYVFQKTFIQKIGGHTPRENVRNALTRIFSNDCGVKCSWKGRRENFAICKLRPIAVMKDMYTRACAWVCMMYILMN